MPTNSIGEHEFVTLRGLVERPFERPEIVERFGVEGTALWLTGRRGKPFTMRSLVDVIDLADGHRRVKQYGELIGEDPIRMIAGGYDYSSENWLVQVLAVRPLRVQIVKTPCGGLSNGNAAICEVEWTLVAIPTQPAEPPVEE